MGASAPCVGRSLPDERPGLAGCGEDSEVGKANATGPWDEMLARSPNWPSLSLLPTVFVGLGFSARWRPILTSLVLRRQNVYDAFTVLYAPFTSLNEPLNGGV